MDDISILEELGLEEVSRKTHIETKYLEYMVNKKFEKLSRINTLGFVKILRREYRLDLQEWVNEFEAFLGTNEQETSLKDTAMQQDISDEKSSAWVYFLLLFIILLGVGFWYFDGMKYVNQLKENFYEKNTSTFTQAPIVKETKEKLESLEAKAEPTIETVEILSTKKNMEENDTILQDSPEEITDTNVTATMIEEPNKVENIDNIVQDNTTAQTVEKIEILNIQTVDNETLQANEEETKELQTTQNSQETTQELPQKIVIKPYKKIWIGTINLKTKKRLTKLTKDDITLDIQDPQLLIVGHGNFIFELGDGKTQKSSDKLKSYYHIADGEIKYITKKEFIKLNGGKNW